MTSNQQPGKCEGRFPEIRRVLETLIMELARHIKNPLTLENMKDMYSTFEAEIKGADARDPYFQSGDHGRPNPPNTPNALVPLLTRTNRVNAECIDAYIGALNCRGGTEKHLNQFTEGKDVTRAADGLAAGYLIKANFGIGGTNNAIIVTDSPFSLEAWNLQNEHALTVGFWIVKDGEKTGMIIDQIQTASTEGLRPSDAGLYALGLARGFAQKMELDFVATYAAQHHPMFKANPKKKRQIVNDLRKLHDNPARQLGFSANLPYLFRYDLSKK